MSFEVVSGFHGIAGMIICGPKDSTEAEILEACNRLNPSGTSNGWSVVVTDDKEYPQNNPIECQQDSSRMHWIVYC